MKLILFLLLLSFSYSQSDIGTIYFVRHAEKMKDGSKNPALNELGKKNAKRLVTFLKDAEIEAIFSTDYTRTQNTVKPLADALKLKIQSYHPYKSESLKKSVNENFSNKSVLIVGHSNTLSKTIMDFDGKDIGEINEADYSNFFILNRVMINGKVQTKLIRLHL